MAKKRFNEGLPHLHCPSEGKWGRQLDNLKTTMVDHIKQSQSVVVPQHVLHVRDGSHNIVREIHPDHIVLQSHKDSSILRPFIVDLDLCSLSAICDYLDYIMSSD